MSELPRLTRHRAPANPGIVHIGPGAFFKAFNAVYTDDVLRQAGGDWGIIAVSLQSDRAAQQLRPQGCAYTAVALGAEGRDARVIEAICDVLVAAQDPRAVVDAMADPRIHIVSLTITEKGYCHLPSTGALNLDLPDIKADLSSPEVPRTAPGFLVEALARRRAAGVPPFTVLSCDNLPENGATARRVLLDFAAARDPELAAWIASDVSFPSTMVDRITPATTSDDVARLGEDEGYFDPACVVHEPFRQWVIEDNFSSGRPDWALAGAQFVASVKAHELMKLRCLNGTHSTLAYLGYLSGFETVAETVAQDDFAMLCQRLWAEEILPTVPVPEGGDLELYTSALLDRYRNPAIQHRTWQVAMDGSQKLPQRLLQTISERLAAGAIPQGLCLAVAGWMRYVSGTDEDGHPIDVRDPLADRLHEAYAAGNTASERARHLISIEDVFPQHLRQDVRFVSNVSQALDRIERDGAQASVAAFVKS